MLNLNTVSIGFAIAVFVASCGGSDRAALGFPYAGQLLEQNNDDSSSEKDTVAMSAIPAGCFQMGDSFSEGGDFERPVHEVCVSAFQMDVYEVTNVRYKACVDDGVCAQPHATDNFSDQPYFGTENYRDYPVVAVDWQMASTYCNWADKRLPTEAEWEYASRGGSSGRRFPWGDVIDCNQANYWSDTTTYTYDGGNDGESGACAGSTVPVGSYTSNGYGLYEIAGNVSEWTNDWWNANYYSESPRQDPQGPENSIDARIFRGGSFLHYPSALRNAARGATDPTSAFYTIGFRCVR